MTPEAQNIALAEASGWTQIGLWNAFDHSHFLCPHGKETEQVGILDCGLRPGVTGGVCHKIPNFAADLNAQFEAWQKLTAIQKLRFSNEIYRLALRDGIRPEEAQYRFGCECLLRALRKWIE